MTASDLYDKPGHLIRRCHQISLGLFLDRCAEFQLTPVQYALLKAAEAEPGADQITLAGMAALDRSNAARLAAALEARGLLRRAPDPKDRRVRRLSLTAEGKALLRRVEPTVQRMQEELLAPLTAEERRIFLRALRKIAAAHNEISRAPLRLPESGEAA
ncbi:MAG: MarR family transcriptional regulator [Rhodovarius sp.]|nr:MarR family transcriptional regulator [Rhodovarius sp.]MDW8316004.1 MarR family transcriptional regulator [Rhodovarius sp.]